MNKKILTLTSLVLFISLGFSLFQGYKRHLADQAYKNVQVLVHYDDLVSFSRLTDQSLESVSEQFKAAGATGVLVKERTIRATLVNAQNSLEQSLEAVTYSGIELLSRNNTIQGFDYRRFYGWIPDEGIRSSVMRHLGWKRGYGDSVFMEDRVLVDYGPGDLSVLGIGVGYPIENLEKIASAGLTISPQIKDWETSDSDVLELVLEEVRRLPGLGDIYFNDVTIPNVKHDAMKQLAQNHTIGYIEFFSNRQRGIGELIKTPSNGDALSVVRMHSLTGQQIATRPLRQNMDQLMLAVNERNIRSILIGFPLVGHPDEMLESALAFVSQFKSEIEAEGFALSAETHWFELPLQSGLQVLLIGLGPIFALVFLGHLMNQVKMSYALVLLGTLGYTGLLYLSPYLAKQAMALYASIIFPTLGMVYVLKSPVKGIGMATWKYLSAALISLMGSLTVVGILSEPAYAMGLDQFRGVKLVSVVPLLLFAALMFYKEGGFEWPKIKSFLCKHVNYITLIALALVAVVLFRYVQRTGNTASVSSLELSFRQLLNNVMGIRPRTKEFLIGHPIFLMTLWMGYQKKWLPLILVALIGQVSMVNTFAHLHTPVMVSVIRTFHGLWLGLLIGLCGCFVLAQFEKIMKRRKSNV